MDVQEIIWQAFAVVGITELVTRALGRDGEL